MSKYNFDLDMRNPNPCSVILDRIALGSFVYEFGCSHGRMTKYLKESLGCYVTACEIDTEAALQAAPYTIHNNQVCIGMAMGKDADLNNLDAKWQENVLDFKYKYLLFADVLEHLDDAEATLKHSLKFLHSDGEVWISIPNISHNAVIIDLINNRFQYRDTGILDKTHKRFFTEESLDKFVDDCGLRVIEKHNLINTVSNTEFNNSYNDVSKEVANFLKVRTNGEVYHFVWRLARK